MAVNVSIGKASGRSTCRSCMELIVEGADVIIIKSLQSRKYFHYSCARNIVDDVPKPDDVKNRHELFSAGSSINKIEIWQNSQPVEQNVPYAKGLLKKEWIWSLH